MVFLKKCFRMDIANFFRHAVNMDTMQLKNTARLLVAQKQCGEFCDAIRFQKAVRTQFEKFYFVTMRQKLILFLIVRI